MALIRKPDKKKQVDALSAELVNMHHGSHNGPAPAVLPLNKCEAKSRCRPLTSALATLPASLAAQ
jgi:hypothetical protein